MVAAGLIAVPEGRVHVICAVVAAQDPNESEAGEPVHLHRAQTTGHSRGLSPFPQAISWKRKVCVDIDVRPLRRLCRALCFVSSDLCEELRVGRHISGGERDAHIGGARVEQFPCSPPQYPFHRCPSPDAHRLPVTLIASTSM